MQLNELVKELNKLISAGHGDLEVFACHGASGACDPVGHPNIQTIDGNEDCGPWDMDVGTNYVDIYIGN